MARAFTDADYGRLLAFRTALRRFERWSADRAGEQGLTAGQHQLLLAVRGHPGPLGPTIGEVADYLVVRHNTAVELVDRAQEHGLVERVGDPDNHKVVRLVATAEGRALLRTLTEAHREEYARIRPLLTGLLAELTDG